MTASQSSRPGRWRLAVTIAVAVPVAVSGRSAPEVLALTGDVAPVHDPVVGRSMLEGGGTVVIEAATDSWRGAGHQAVFRDGDRDYLFFHAYFGPGRGRRSALQISTMAWEDGWPRAGVHDYSAVNLSKIRRRGMATMPVTGYCTFHTTRE